MNYSFLRGKIVEKCGTCGNFASKLNITKQELSKKLASESKFTQGQIFSSIDILNLNDEELRKCFFIEN